RPCRRTASPYDFEPAETFGRARRRWELKARGAGPAALEKGQQLMASISTSKKTGRRKIHFTAPDGDRKTVRLGKVPLKYASEFKTRVEWILSAAEQGFALDGETARWLGELSDILHKRLLRTGIVLPRVPAAAMQLGDWLTRYIDRRSDVKPSTRRHMNDC